MNTNIRSCLKIFIIIFFKVFTLITNIIFNYRFFFRLILFMSIYLAILFHLYLLHNRLILNFYLYYLFLAVDTALWTFGITVNKICDGIVILVINYISFELWLRAIITQFNAWLLLRFGMLLARNRVYCIGFDNAVFNWRFTCYLHIILFDWIFNYWLMNTFFDTWRFEINNLIWGLIWAFKVVELKIFWCLTVFVYSILLTFFREISISSSNNIINNWIFLDVILNSIFNIIIEVRILLIVIVIILFDCIFHTLLIALLVWYSLI